MATENQPLQDDIKSIKEILKTLATEHSVSDLKRELKSEVQKLYDSFDKAFKDYKQEVTDKLDHFETRLYEAERRFDKVESDNEDLKMENERLKDRVQNMERDMNDLEQYGRRWNLRVFGVEESKSESTGEVTQKVCNLFTDKLGIKTTAADLEACHRTGSLEKARHSKKTRPVIVRFMNRSLRDALLKKRQVLKGSGVSVGEDLTKYNADLSKAAFKHEAVSSSYSINGKIFVKLKDDDRKLRLHYGCDIKQFLNDAVKNKPVPIVTEGQNADQEESPEID